MPDSNLKRFTHFAAINLALFSCVFLIARCDNGKSASYTAAMQTADAESKVWALKNAPLPNR
jgi:hypothetical protein